jgi:hypothetical protein
VALATDVNVIDLAWEGQREHDNAMGWMMYRAALHIRPPPMPDELRPRMRPAAGEIRQWARAHNERLATARTAKDAREAAAQRARDGIQPKT